VYVNSFAKGTAKIDLPGGADHDRSGHPLSVGRRGEDDREAEQARRFAINVRIPGWARSEPVPSDSIASSTTPALGDDDGRTARRRP
jgi:hypothetical protein